MSATQAHVTMHTDGLSIHVLPATNPPGKLADVELHFDVGPLAGLKLVGLAVWQRRDGNPPNVTFPARQYSVNGERRSFALLRPVTDQAEADSLRARILAAYAAYEAER